MFRKTVMVMDELLKRAKEGTPVTGGEAAAFVWRGKSAPQLTGDSTDWEEGPAASLTQVAPE
jgi:hypothetical protein